MFCYRYNTTLCMLELSIALNHLTYVKASIYFFTMNVSVRQMVQKVLAFVLVIFVLWK